MECPSCGTLEAHRETVCPQCGTTYAGEDLLALRQLEFLLAQMDAWAERLPANLIEELRQPYAEQLANLRARLIPEPAPSPPPVEETAVPAQEVPAAPPAVEVEPVPVREASEVHPAPKAERVLFDEWLLSVRNIKVALYSGAVLLVLAGIIFIGSKWGELGGPAKFGVMLLATGLVYLGGYLLYQRPALRPGGIAVLGVASGFLPLNFAVLQIYVLGPGGFQDDVMWLIASPMRLLLYTLTAYWTRSDLFTYIGIGALVSTLAAGLTVAGAPDLAYPLAYLLLALTLLLLAWRLQNTRLAPFTRKPLLVTAHLAAPLLTLAALLGFVLLNFGLGFGGSPWLALAGLFAGVLFYVATDALFGWWAARWAAAGLFPGAFALTLVHLGLSDTALGLALVLLAMAYLGVGNRLERLQGQRAAGWPLYIVAHILGGVVTFLLAVAALGFAFGGSPWLALAGMFIGVLLYATTDALLGWWAARWAAAGLFAVVFGLTLARLGFGDMALGVALMLLAMAYLGVGYRLEQLQERRAAGLPLYAVAYILAGWVTLFATGNTPHLILALLGDVAMLALSAAIFRHYAWVYSAVWLFMLPVYLFLAQTVPVLANRGLLMGVLGLNYLAAGYALSRQEVGAGTWPRPSTGSGHRRGGPFLTAAAFLSAVVVVLAWGNPLIVTLLLAVVAALYLGVALWLDRPLLLLVTLAGVHLGVFTAQAIFLGYGVINLRALDVAYAALALTLLPGGLWLRRQGHGRWATPLYVVGALDLAGSYAAALLDWPMLAIALSAIYATLLLTFAWLERPATQKQAPLPQSWGRGRGWGPASRLPGLRDTPVLTYLGLGTIVVGHFYALDAAGLLRDWPAFTAGLCGLFVLIAWLLRREDLAAVYGVPLRWAGLGLALLPMAGALPSQRPLLIAAAFGIVGLTYGADAVARRVLYQVYVAGAAFLVVYWALLIHLGVNEPQAYVIPPGLALLGLGWNEGRRGDNLNVYRVTTALGLAILLGSSFVQSLSHGGAVYAIWLGMESLAAIGWGMRNRSRGYVSLGTLALVTNAVAQLGPAFVELPRWIQLGITGGTLLGGGIVFLVRREKLLATRRALTEEWQGWQP
jgi:hypothetical protein